MNFEVHDLAVHYAEMKDPEIKSDDEEMALIHGLSVLMSERRLFSVIMRAKKTLSDVFALDYSVRYELPTSLSVLEVCALFTGDDPCERNLSIATLSFYRLIRLSMCRDGFAKDVLAKVKCNM